MAKETNRKTLLKRISQPSNPENFVDVPVIQEISFVDQKDDAQERRFRFVNADKSSRKTHVITIDSLEIERVDQVTIVDHKTDGQEYVYRLTNDDDPPRHRKTHRVRLYQNNDTNSGNYLEIDYVDEMDVLDHKSDSQDRVLVLSGNLQDGDEVDLTLDYYDAQESVDPPYRLDPFQNVVGAHWGNVPVLCFAGLSGQVSKAIFSTDGHVWTSWDLSQIWHPTTSIASGAGCWVGSGGFFVDGANSHASIYRSVDGRNWTPVLTSNTQKAYLVYTQLSGAPDSPRGRFYLNATDESGNQRLYSSLDGKTWDNGIALKTEGFPSPSCLSLVDGVLYAGVTWGDSTSDPVGYDIIRCALFRSTDGVNWEDLGELFSSLTYEDSDGVHTASVQISGVCAGHGRYLVDAQVSVDSTGLGRYNIAVVSSLDGTTFGEPLVLEMSPGWNGTTKAPIYVDGVFVIGGGAYENTPPPSTFPLPTGTLISAYPDKGIIGVSSDGESWTYYEPIPIIGSNSDGSQAVDLSMIIPAGPSTFALAAMHSSPATSSDFIVRTFLASLTSGGVVSFAEVGNDFNSSLGGENFLYFADILSMSPPTLT